MRLAATATEQVQDERERPEETKDNGNGKERTSYGTGPSNYH